jgi:hypothetical protein
MMTNEVEAPLTASQNAEIFLSGILAACQEADVDDNGKNGVRAQECDIPAKPSGNGSYGDKASPRKGSVLGEGVTPLISPLPVPVAVAATQLSASCTDVMLDITRAPRLTMKKYSFKKSVQHNEIAIAHPLKKAQGYDEGDAPPCSAGHGIGPPSAPSAATTAPSTATTVPAAAARAAAARASPEEVLELIRRKRSETGGKCDQSTCDLMDAQLLEALIGMSAIELRRLLEALKGMSAIEMQRYQADICAQLA